MGSLAARDTSCKWNKMIMMTMKRMTMMTMMTKTIMMMKMLMMVTHRKQEERYKGYNFYKQEDGDNMLFQIFSGLSLIQSRS